MREEFSEVHRFCRLKLAGRKHQSEIVPHPVGQVLHFMRKGLDGDDIVAGGIGGMPGKPPFQRGEVPL